MNFAPVQDVLTGLAAGLAGAGTGAALILSGFLVPLVFEHLDHQRADRIARLFLASSGPLIGVVFLIAGALALIGFSIGAGVTFLACGCLFALSGLAAFPRSKRRLPGTRRDLAAQRRVAQLMVFFLTPIAAIGVALAAFGV